MAKEQYGAGHLKEWAPAILHELPVGLLWVDSSGYVCFTNDKVADLLGNNCQGVLWSRCAKTYFAPKEDDGFEVSTIAGKKLGLSTQPAPDGQGQIIVIYDLTATRHFQEKLLRGMTKLPKKTTERSALGSPEPWVFEDPKTLALLHTAQKVAKTNVPVLLNGESGVGKEVFAQFIRLHSNRSDGPFIAMNCAAYPSTLLQAVLFGCVKGAFTGSQNSEGKFMLANNGTLFLDELTEMDPDSLAMLLRVMSENEIQPLGSNKVYSIDTRIIAASNRNMDEAVAQGRMREDLRYRFAFELEIPPLRERPGDILPIAHLLLRQHVAQLGIEAEGFTADAEQRLLAYSWPGNVRQLKNAIIRALVIKSGPVIGYEDLNGLPDHLSKHSSGKFTDHGAGLVHHHSAPEGAVGLPSGDSLAVAASPVTMMYRNKMRVFTEIQDVLRSCNGSRKEAAKRLGMSERNLRYKLAEMEKSGFSHRAVKTGG